MANLNIIYDNYARYAATTITASSSQASGPVSNLKLDQKSRVWRTTANGTSSNWSYGNLLIDFGVSRTVGGVVLSFTDASSTADFMIVRSWNSPPTLGGSVNAPTLVGGSMQNSSGTVLCCPWNSLNLPIYSSTSSSAYGGSTYVRAFLSTPLTARYFTIELGFYNATASTGGFVEAGNLIIGPVWTPKYNTSFGLSSAIKDDSSHSRTEAGDLVSVRGFRYNTLDFDLKWLDMSDRFEFSRLCLGNGSSNPVFVSLFPNNTANWETERAHMVYGKIKTVPGIDYFAPNLYSTKISIEEI
jgi:hypothetical protein